SFLVKRLNAKGAGNAFLAWRNDYTFLFWAALARIERGLFPILRFAPEYFSARNRQDSSHCRREPFRLIRPRALRLNFGRYRDSPRLLHPHQLYRRTNRFRAYVYTLPLLNRRLVP